MVASACSHLGRQSHLHLQGPDPAEGAEISSLTSQDPSRRPAEFAFAKSLKVTQSEPLRGLEFVSEGEREQWLSRAEAYIELRKGNVDQELGRGFSQDCDPVDPFCWLYRKSLEPPPPRRARPREVGPPRVSAAQVRQWLLGGEYDRLKEVSERDIRRGVASFRDLTSLNRAVDRSGLLEACELPFVSMAFASKFEEHLPAQEVRHRVVELYERAANCDEGLTGVRASFRAAVMGLWVYGCTRALPYLERIAFHPEVSDYQSRGLYWILSCRQEFSGQQELLARAASALQSRYPLSLQNILASAQDSSGEMKIHQFLSRQDTQVWLRLPQEQDPDLVNAWLGAIESLEELDERGLAREALLELTRRWLDGEIEALAPALRLYLAVLLDRHEDHLNKFRIMAPLLRDHQELLSRSSLKLFYPNNYFEVETGDEFEVRARKENQWGVDTHLLLALIRQESAFQRRARSPAGARGLMQLMPRTARSFERVSLEDLYDPEINKRIGSQYLRQLLRRYDGDVEVVLAAYNAGPSRIGEWRRRYPTEDRMLFVDLFPFRETRDYVAAIARNYFWYSQLYGQNQDLPQPNRASFQLLSPVLEN